jgi:serine/threonine-protein kinase
VADFGIALAASRAGDSRMTETGMSLGTPHYMSPEQAMGQREITARSDIYSLGVMTYEMLLGEPPFTGPTAQAIVAKVMSDAPAPPSRHRDTVPEAVDDAVLTALAKFPADRFATAAEFAAALIADGIPGRRSALEPRAPAATPSGRRAALYGGLARAAILALAAILNVSARPRAGAASAAPVMRSVCSIRPAIRSVGASSVNYQTATFTVNHVTAHQQLGAYEPFNVTNEFGVRLGLHF